MAFCQNALIDTVLILCSPLKKKNWKFTERIEMHTILSFALFTCNLKKVVQKAIQCKYTFWKVCLIFWTCRYSTSKSDKSFYSLTWTVKLEHNHDTVYFAHCFPYTYTDLQVSLSQMPPSLSFAGESLLFCKCRGDESEKLLGWLVYTSWPWKVDDLNIRMSDLGKICWLCVFSTFMFWIALFYQDLM